MNTSTNCTDLHRSQDSHILDVEESASWTKLNSYSDTVPSEIALLSSTSASMALWLSFCFVKTARSLTFFLFLRKIMSL